MATVSGPCAKWSDLLSWMNDQTPPSGGTEDLWNDYKSKLSDEVANSPQTVVLTIEVGPPQTQQ